MTDYYRKYKNYLGIGNSLDIDGFMNQTKEFISTSEFLFREKVLVNDKEYLVGIKTEKKSDTFKLIFEPCVNIDLGSIVKLKDENYLVDEFLGKGIYELYPTATVKRCNNLFPIVVGKIEEIVRDQYGNPIKDTLTKEVVTKEIDDIEYIPCIVEGNFRSTDKENKIFLPRDEIIIDLPYRQEIKLDYKFILYDNEHFKVINLDRSKVYKEKGLLTITAKREVKSNGNG